MERGVRHVLSQQELVIDDRIDVPPTHRILSVERVYLGGMYRKKAKNEEFHERMPQEPGAVWRHPMVVESSTFVLAYRD